jgi:hypothetical protein
MGSFNPYCVAIIDRQAAPQSRWSCCNIIFINIIALKNNYRGQTNLGLYNQSNLEHFSAAQANEMEPPASPSVCRATLRASLAAINRPHLGCIQSLHSLPPPLIGMFIVRWNSHLTIKYNKVYILKA